MNENDLRDCFAMFAMLGLVINVKGGKALGECAYEIADQMLEARNKEPEVEEGIVAVKPKRRTK